MAVFTDISATTIQKIIQRYNIGAYVQHVGLVAGSTNSNFLVETTENKYIFTIHEAPLSREHLAAQINQINSLAKQQRGIPRILHSKQGTYIQEIEDKPATLQSFAKGRPMETPQPDHTQRAGAILARMHLAAESIQPPHPEEITTLSHVHNLLEKCQQIAPEGSDAARALPDLITESLHQQEAWHNMPQLPKGLCHNDFFMDNVFFDNEHTCGVIDWWFSGHAPFAVDLAIGLCAWGFDDADGQIIPDQFTRFLRGYTNNRPLDDEETRCLNWALRRAALRFCATRLHDTLTDKGFIADKPWQSWFARLNFFQSNMEVAYVSA